jgi:hypothetical protein
MFKDRRSERKPARVTGLQADLPMERYESHDWRSQ